MKIKFVGTSSGKAEADRFHSSLLIDRDNYFILIDAGDGISHALINSKISMEIIDSLVITHFHPDHISGFSSFVNQQKMLKRNRELKVFIPKGFGEALINLLRYNYIFSEELDFNLEAIEYCENEVILDFIIPRKNKHVWNKYNVSYFRDEYFSSYSLLLKGKEQSIHYTSDIADGNDLEIFKDFSGIRILISEFTHIDTETLEEFISKRNFEKVYLTHYSSDVIPEMKFLKNKYENVYIAEENFEFLF